jgi:hypothetical protein
MFLLIRLWRDSKVDNIWNASFLAEGTANAKT